MLNELQKALKANLKVQVTVWDPHDDSVEHTFTSTIMETVGLMLRIASPVENADTIMPLMRKEFVVGIVLESNPNPYIFYPVIRIEAQKPTDGYWLAIPDNAEVEIFQRRKHVRIQMVLPIEVEYFVGVPATAMKMSARTSDLSGGGLRFTSSYNFSSGELLSIHLKLDEAEPMLRLRAKVIFTMENRHRQHADDLYATACQFIHIDDAQEMMLVRECFRRELKLKQNP